MAFVLSKILWDILRPSSFILILLLLGAVAWWRRDSRWGRRLTLAAGGLLLAIAVLPIAGWALMPLESRFAVQRTPPSRVDGIIVLGGAVDTVLTAKWGIPSLNYSAERMTEFVHLAREYPSAKLVFTGGSGLLFAGEVTESDVARQLFADLGVDPSRVMFEDKSRNTFENAEFSKALAKPQPGETWILVTSASHMVRSVAVFDAVGWDVLPWPVGFKANLNWYIDLGQHLRDLDWAAHEWSGLISYRLMGRTRSLLPAAKPSPPMATGRQAEHQQ